MDTLSTKKSFLIGYHNRLCADGLKSILSNNDQDVSIDTIQNGRSLVNQLKSKKYDLLIVDLIYPGCDSIGYLTEIKRTYRSQKILLISDLIQNGSLVDILNTGIEGYILHTCSSRDLENAMTRILNNENYVCTTITTQVLRSLKESANQSQVISLTNREKEILGYLIKMHSNKSIAEQLNISELTVKTHRKNLMKKFGSKNLLSLVRYACRENLINGDSDDFCKGCPHKNRYQLNYN